jgi:RHS repeat-associated protein
MAAQPAQALVGGPTPGAASASTLKLPDKPGSIKGLADAASVNTFSAQVRYGVPLSLPGGRNGFGPSLALTYLGELGNGPLGIGWQLSQISIRRSLRHGVPLYTDADELELVGLGGGGRLVPAGDGTYWVEGQGRSIRVRYSGSWFDVTDSEGTHYFLGLTPAGVQGDPGKPNAWYVQTIQNVAGERIGFSYRRDGGQLYLEEVTWGPGDPTMFKLAVQLEQRSDVTVSWATGTEVRTALRIRSLTVSATGARVRKYQLTYDNDSGDVFARQKLSRLTVVRMFGTTDAESMPAVTLGYVPPLAPDVKELEATDHWQLNERGVTLLDVDGDGISDLTRLELGQHVYKKNQAGALASPRGLPGAGHIELGACRLMDLDGDARPELVHIVDDTWRVYGLVGHAQDFRWEARGEWPGTRNVPLFGAGVVFADLNGDGRTDVVEASSDGLRARFATQTGLGPAVRLPPVSSGDLAVEPGRSDVHFIDANGDGLADVVWLADEWMKTWLGRGDGTFAPFNRVAYPWPVAPSVAGDIQLADLDRDGLLDVIRFTAGHVLWFPGLTDGRISKDGRTVARPYAASADSAVGIGDVNGNGSQDLVWSGPKGIFSVDFAGAAHAGMLASIDNGMGSVTSFQYQASGQISVADEDAGRPWDLKLPASIPVPVTVEVDPGGGGLLRRTQYGVRDGFWDGEERRFGGFLIAGQTLPGATAAEVATTETRFHPGTGQDRALRGRAWYVRNEDGLGNVLSVSKTLWETIQLPDLPVNPLLRHAVERSRSTFEYEGVATPIETRTLFEHDTEGRVTFERALGRLDRDDDQKVIARTYNSNDVNWVRNKICSETLFEADAYGVTSASQMVHNIRNSYGDENGAAPRDGDLCGIGKGWLIQTFSDLRAAEVSHCDETSDRPDIETTFRKYDRFGNPLVTRANGVERTVQYDSVDLYPEVEFVTPEVNRNLTWRVTWDRVQGLPLTLTDPNNDVARATYDGVGRITSLALNAHPAHEHFVYRWNVPAQAAVPMNYTYVFDGAPTDSRMATVPSPEVSRSGWRESVEVTNGAGEDLYVATRLGLTTWIMSGWKERDPRGQEIVAAAPFYFQGTVLPTGRPAGFGSFEKTFYDSFGRIWRQELPSVNGRVSERIFAYAAFEQTMTTTDLAPVRTVHDGLGRPVRTHRTVSGTVEEVDARYDAAGRITTMSLQSGKAILSFTYDTLGRMVKAKDPDIGERKLCYLDSGLLSRHTNGQGQVLGFSYDGIGRVIRKGPGLTRGSGDFVFTYDRPDPKFPDKARTQGRLASITEPTGQDGLAVWYDEFGRQSVVSRKIGSQEAWEQTLFMASGLVAESSAGDGFKAVPAYDQAGRLKGLTDDGLNGHIWRVGQGGSFSETTDIDAAGRVVNETYANGLIQSYTRDDRGLPSLISLRDPAAPPNVFTYRVRITDRTGYGAPIAVSDEASQGVDHAAQYQYDLGGRIERAVLGSTPSNTWDFRFQYDGLQNMTARFQKGPGSQSLGIISGYYRYGEKVGGIQRGPRQLTSILHRDCRGEFSTFGYDEAGRQTNENQKTLTYDAFDNLTSVAIPITGTVTYTYGYDGQRTTASTAGNTQVWFSPNHTLKGSQRQHYVTVGDRLVARLTFANSSTVPPQPLTPLQMATNWLPDVGSLLQRHAPTVLAGGFLASCILLVALALRRGSRPAWQTVPAVATVAIYGWLSAGCTEVDSQRRGAETAPRQYFHQGIAPGPAVITSPNKSVLEELRSEPFGQPIEPVALTQDPHNSLNKETDPTTQLSYHGARWMAPQTGRWTAPDPSVKAPEPKFMASPWGLHPYQYAQQNPTLLWDADGLDNATNPLDSPVAFKPEGGHHYVATKDVVAPIAKEMGLSKEFVDYLKTQTTGWGERIARHQFSGWHKAYDQEVSPMLRRFVLEKAAGGVAPGQLGGSTHGAEFVSRVKASQNPIIHEFIEVHETVADLVKAGVSKRSIEAYWIPKRFGMTIKGGFTAAKARAAGIADGLNTICYIWPIVRNRLETWWFKQRGFVEFQQSDPETGAFDLFEHVFVHKDDVDRMLMEQGEKNPKWNLYQ